MINTQEKSKKAKKRLFIESIAIFLIISAPFIFKLHDFLPRDPNRTISFFWLEIDRNGFTDLRTYGGFILNKLVPFYLLLIWFFTNKHWWYHIILIPICMYAFQLFEVLYSQDLFVDTENVLWLLPVCMVIIPFVYLIRIKLYDKHVLGIDLDAMDAELQYYKDKERRENEKILTPNHKDPLADQVQVVEVSDDLSKSTPDKILKKALEGLQHSLKSFFNIFF
ncbi:MAG: hypothetical protein WBN11_00650 [Eudoraea sp.]|uniref:hypothetical protein n=1 Tax=Eudoraea sp. TaxID=1979955 RepID=UPI003C770F14